MNFGKNAKSLAAARASLDRQRRKRRQEAEALNQPQYMAACGVCEQTCAIIRGKRYDVDDGGAWVIHPHQPKGFQAGWFKVGRGQKLTAADFMDS